MLEDKWPSSLGVALGADCILCSSVAELLTLKGSMSIVTIGTLHQPLVDLVMKGHRELRLDIRVALKTQLRLSYL